jgi:F0F1-type ATP synthase assembly protein I
MNIPANWKPIIGWTCLILSLCCTAVFWILPFSGWSVSTIAGGIMAAMLTGKTLLAISVYFLGKKYVDQLKSRFLGRKKAVEKTPLGDNDK